MSSLVERIEGSVAAGDLFEAIEALREFMVGQSNRSSNVSPIFEKLRREIIVLSASAKRINRDRRMGSIGHEHAEIGLSKIGLATVELASEAEAAALRAGTKRPLEVQFGDSLDFDDFESVPELVWGRNSLQSISWLASGIECSRAVCRVVTPNGTGSGFMISGNTILTNNHVLSNADSIENVEVEFNFEEDISGDLKPTYAYCASKLQLDFITDKDLDLTAFRIEENIGCPPLSNWGALRLEPGVKLEQGQPVTIVQHPSGGPKKVSLTDNQVVKVDDVSLFYMTDTMPGSSGSPVFDENWNVVAIHKASGSFKNPVGGITYSNLGTHFKAVFRDHSMRMRLKVAQD